MKKLIVLLLTVTMMLTVCVLSASAYKTEKSAVVMKGTPRISASGSDPIWKKVSGISIDTETTWCDPAPDCGVSVKILYDASRFYMHWVYDRKPIHNGSENPVSTCEFRISGKEVSSLLEVPPLRISFYDKDIWNIGACKTSSDFVCVDYEEGGKYCYDVSLPLADLLPGIPMTEGNDLYLEIILSGCYDKSGTPTKYSKCWSMSSDEAAQYLHGQGTVYFSVVKIGGAVNMDAPDAADTVDMTAAIAALAVVSAAAAVVVVKKKHN